MGPGGLWWTSVLNSALPPQRLRPDTRPEHQDPVSHTDVRGAWFVMDGSRSSLQSAMSDSEQSLDFLMDCAYLLLSKVTNSPTQETNSVGCAYLLVGSHSGTVFMDSTFKNLDSQQLQKYLKGWPYKAIFFPCPAGTKQRLLL